MNLAASIESKLLPKNIITEVRWSAWNDKNEKFGLVKLDEPDLASFIPIEQVTQEKLLEWVKNKIDVAAIENSLMK